MAKPTRPRRVKTAAGVSRETLELVPERTLRFLFGLSRNAEAVRALARFGYGEKERERGIALLDAVLRHQSFDGGDNPARAAMDTLEQEYPIALERLRLASLGYPEAAQTLLGELPERKVRHQEVLLCELLLDRLDALDTTRGAKDARDHIAARGMDAAERKRLRMLVETATKLGKLPDGPGPSALDAQYMERLMSLRVWLEEWSGFARLAIPRRDLLIRLGLAVPRSQVVQPSDPPDEPR